MYRRLRLGGMLRRVCVKVCVLAYGVMFGGSVDLNERNFMHGLVLAEGYV